MSKDEKGNLGESFIFIFNALDMQYTVRLSHA